MNKNPIYYFIRPLKNNKMSVAKVSKCLDEYGLITVYKYFSLT